MILALLCLLTIFLVGLLAVSETRIRLSGVEKLCASFVAGFAIFTPMTFALAYAFHMQAGAFIGLGAAVVALAAFWKRIDWEFRFNNWEAAFLCLVLVSSSVVMLHSHLEFVDNAYRVGTISHGDLMYHLRLINSFAHSDNFPPQEPVYFGEPLKYHFLFDFLSSILITLGMGLVPSVVIPESIMAACLLSLTFCFAARFSGSHLAGLFAAALLALSSGWAYLFSYTQGMSFEKWAAATVDLYSRNTYSFIFGNIGTTLEAQRTLLAGLALLMVVVLLLAIEFRLFGEEKGKAKRGKKESASRAVLLCGILTGLSVLIYAHVFVALVVVCTVLILAFSGNRLRDIALFLVPAGLLALPAVLFLMQGTGTGYPKINFLWEADNLQDSAIFYLRNLGLYLPLLLGGIALADSKRRLFYLGACAVFALANLVQFQTFEYDNYKLVVIWYLLGVFFAAGLLAEIAKRGGKLGVAVAFALLVVACFDGIMFFGYDWSGRWGVFGTDEMDMADWVIANTPPRSVFLTSQNHVHPLATLTGRQIVVGISAWIATRGLEYDVRETEVRAAYSGDSNAMDVIRKYDISYVVVGPDEAGLNPNATFFEESGFFEKVYDKEVSGKRWRIYRVE